MTELFDFKTQSCHFGVMGNPVAHSKSPRLHHLFAQQFDLTIQYDRIQVDVGGFAQAVSHFAAQRGAGLNVTLPFKVEAWRLCSGRGNQLSASAQAAKAVNTLQFGVDQSVFGDNTDGVGLLRDLEQNIGLQLVGKRVLVLGAGGAVRGVLPPLLQRRPATLLIVNRTAHKAQQLAEKFGGASANNPTAGGGAKPQLVGCGYAKLDEHLNEAFDLIIHGTSASLSEPLTASTALPTLSARCLHADSVAYDMMYAHSPTAFMRWASENGAGTVCDGLGMLVEQAAESFLLWHGKRPATGAALSALRNAA